MPELLIKNSSSSLPRQLSEILRRRIERGEYRTGEKMDSVRMLSSEFHISSLTVQRALRQLEADGFTISVPGSGIYINDRFEEEKSPVKIAFVFPEEEISQEYLTPENWSISSEIHRGLLSGAREFGAHADFIYIDRNLELLQMFRQIKRLSQYHALLFVGEQLLELQKKMSETMPVFRFPSRMKDIAGLHTVDYDRKKALYQLAEHVHCCGCRSVGTVVFLHVGEPEEQQWRKYHNTKIPQFLQFCRELGMETSKNYQIELYEGRPFKEQLLRALAGQRPDFLFCSYTDSMRDLYEACMDLKIAIGRDLKIAGMGTRGTLQGLVPTLTYLRVPFFEMAREMVRQTCSIAENQLTSEVLPKFNINAELIIGKSTVSLEQEV